MTNKLLLSIVLKRKVARELINHSAVAAMHFHSVTFAKIDCMKDLLQGIVEHITDLSKMLK